MKTCGYSFSTIMLDALMNSFAKAHEESERPIQQIWDYFTSLCKKNTLDLACIDNTRFWCPTVGYYQNINRGNFRTFHNYVWQYFCEMPMEELDFPWPEWENNMTVPSYYDNNVTIQNSNSTSFYSTGQYNTVKLPNWISPISTNNVKEEENKNMYNFDFGAIDNDSIRISVYGLAVKSVDNRYVSYDCANHSMMDVDIVNIPGKNFLYKIPVALKDVKPGDIIIHNRAPMFVDAVYESTLTVVDIRESTKKEIYPIKSPFGFNFLTKVVSLIDRGGASADTPFGNMLPFLMMGNSENNHMLPLMLMMNTNNSIDPTMLAFAVCGNNNQDYMPFLMMTMMNKNK